MKIWHHFLIMFFRLVIRKEEDMPSSVVASMQYDSTSSTLRVTYVSGNVYDYNSVPASIYKAMKTSGSKGTYLNKYIKGNYPFKKVK